MSAGDLPPSGPAARVDARPAAELRAPPPAPRCAGSSCRSSSSASSRSASAVRSRPSTPAATRSTTSRPRSTPRPTARPPRRPHDAVQGTSLMQPKALKAALAKLPAGDIELLRLAPDRINANVIVKGKMHVVQVTAGGDVTDIMTPATGRGEPVKVNCAAPSADRPHRGQARRPPPLERLLPGPDPHPRQGRVAAVLRRRRALRGVRERQEGPQGRARQSRRTRRGRCRPRRSPARGGGAAGARRRGPPAARRRRR